MAANGHSSHHVIPQKTLVSIFIMLTFLMLATIAAAQLPYIMPGVALFHSPLFTNGLALGIATWKALLVIKYFMGVKYGTGLIKAFAWGGFIWFFTLFVMFFDYSTRQWEPVPGWEPAAPTALPRFPEGDPSVSELPRDSER